MNRDFTSAIVAGGIVLRSLKPIHVCPVDSGARLSTLGDRIVRGTSSQSSDGIVLYRLWLRCLHFVTVDFGLTHDSI